MMTEATMNQHFQEAIRSACEKFYETYQAELADKDRITEFVKTLTFELEKTPEEIVEATMQKNLHTLLYEDIQLNKMKPIWASLIGSKVDNQNKRSLNFGIGDCAPETKKNQINLQLITKNSRQVELLQKNLSILEHNSELPLIAVKIYTSKAEEVKAFAQQMMEMFGAEAIFATLPVKPEIRFVAAEDHLIVEISAKQSLELTFMSYLIRGFLSKLPEHDVEIDLSVLLGTNFSDLINNHSDNTVTDLINGLKINLEFKNNLKGFLAEVCKYFFSKAQKNTDFKREHIKNSFMVKTLEFFLGGISLDANLNLNMGVNEANLMSKIPNINIFDTNGCMLMTPIASAQTMMEENEMIAPVIDLLKTMEGKGELYLMSPILGAFGEIDISGALDLALHLIKLFGMEEE